MASLLSVQTFILISFLIAIGLLVATWRMLRSQRASRRFQDLEVESRGLVQPLRRMMPRFRHELARSRRYDRTLSAVMLSLNEPDITPATNGNGANGSAGVAAIWALAAGSLIQDSLRDSDLVGWDLAMNRYVALLPETNLQQSRQAANRLIGLIREHVPVHVSAGVSEFKADGVTVEDLLTRAAERCAQSWVAVAAPAAEAPAVAIEGARIERSIIELRGNEGVSFS
jgi:hypothetical protein